MHALRRGRSGTVMVSVCLAMMTLMTPLTTWSQERTPPPEEAVEGPPEAIDAGVLPLTVALVPGVLIHGLGHMVAGDVETGLELLGMEALGVGLIIAGGAPLVATGASRKLVTPTISTILVGFGLFVQSWTADIYGASTGGTSMQARTELPLLEAELGYRYIYDPQFAYRNFTTAEANLRFSQWRLSPSAWVAVDDDNQRLRLEGSYRFLGPQQGILAATDGSFLDLDTALTWHGYGTDGFSVSTMEVSAQSRLDLQNWSPSLRGSFATMGLGIGLEGYSYDIEGLSLIEDTAEVLLMRFGYGFYLSQGSEVLFYYDHRHDDFAAGLGVEGLGGGAAGHFGTQGFYVLDPSWALTWDVQVGSAYIAGLGLRMMWEGAR